MLVVVVVVSASAATTMPQRKKKGGHFSTGVLSLHEGVILLQLEGVLFLRSGVIFLRKIMTRVIPLRSKMTRGCHFVRGGHFSALHRHIISRRTDLYVIWDGPITAERYRDEILHPFERAYAGAVGQNFVLMDDDARQSCAALS